MSPDPQLTDHESILLIRQEIQQLERSQSEFHKEMRIAFTDLKDNYAGRLNEHDKQLSDLCATRQDFRTKIKETNVWLSWLAGAVGIIGSVVFFHLTGYHI